MEAQRRRLPSKDEIEKITDVYELNDWQDYAETNLASITTQLEYGSGDDDWYGRTMGAKTAHQIALTNIRKRIYRLSKGATDNSQVLVQKQITKVEKARLQSINKENAAKQTQAAAERDKLKTSTHIANTIQKTSLQSCFVWAAKTSLDSGVFDLIMNKAIAMQEKRLSAELSI